MTNLLRLSEASNLAIHALAYMANLGPNTPVSATKIASDIHVSETHLSKVLQNLARDGFIASTRGAKGGFFFEREPGEISLLDIIIAVDGPLPQHECLLNQKVCAGPQCKLIHLMQRTTDFLANELGDVKLKEFILHPTEQNRISVQA